MAISVNSVVGFNSTLQAKYHRVSRSSVGASAPKVIHLVSSWGVFGSRGLIKERRRNLCHSVADSNHLAQDTRDKGPEGAELPISDNQLSAVNSSSVDPLGGNGQPQTRVDDESGPGPQTSVSSNDSMVSSDMKQESRPNLQSTLKRSPLTARERLRAARVLSRYTETKASKSKMGKKVLDALIESDRGKQRSGLPQAPTNLFDDSKRGLPKEGWTFQFPGGTDLFFIVLSFVLISTIMFGTTYVVWKSGAIHFNEY